MNIEIENKIFDFAVRVITQDFQSIKNSTKDEMIYGFGLGLVSDITGFFSAANTLESLNNKIAINGDDHPSSYWSMPEWKYEGVGSREFHDYLTSFIDEDEMDDDQYEAVRKKYENILIKALIYCDKNGLFGLGPERENIVIYIQYADAFDEEIDNFSSQKINSISLHSQFEHRWNDNKNNLTEVVRQRMQKQ